MLLSFMLMKMETSWSITAKGSYTITISGSTESSVTSAGHGKDVATGYKVSTVDYSFTWNNVKHSGTISFDLTCGADSSSTKTLVCRSLSKSSTTREY